jgi:hypothetical protein
MTPERWNEILARSHDVGPIRPPNEGLARGAVRVYLVISANAGDGPIGIVTDRRCLLPYERPILPPPSGPSAMSQRMMRWHAERRARGLKPPAPGRRDPVKENDDDGKR